jgi:hypothetical protein
MAVMPTFLIYVSMEEISVDLVRINLCKQTDQFMYPARLRKKVPLALRGAGANRSYLIF